jgi:hypothetical protein
MMLSPVYAAMRNQSVSGGIQLQLGVYWMGGVRSMKRVWAAGATIVAGVLLSGGHALSQSFTMSAKPGVLNYVEGEVYLNGDRLSHEAVRATFLHANDTLSTDSGKAEVLLTPGVFLRLGSNAEVRMISAGLVDT